MARRASSTTKTPEEIEVTVDTVDVPVETPEDDTPAEVDLTEFEAAVATAVDGRDTTTGTVPPALLDVVTTAYRTLDGVGPKSKAKKFVSDNMVSAMSESLDLARAYLECQNSLTSDKGKGPGKPRTERKPFDPTQSYVTKLAVLRVASAVLQGNKPEGLSEDVDSLLEKEIDRVMTAVNTFLSTSEDLRGEPENDVSTVLRYMKISKPRQGASGEAGPRYSGPRRDLGSHIIQALTAAGKGEFVTIGDIRKFHSDQYEGNAASAGAINARLFPNSGVTSLAGQGVVAVEQGGKKGAYIQ